jgi:hypothetical protein
LQNAPSNYMHPCVAQNKNHEHTQHSWFYKTMIILYSLQTLIRPIIINWQCHKVVPPNLQALKISLSIKIVAMFMYKTTMMQLDAFSTYTKKFCANNLLSLSSTRFACICTKIWWCWAYIMINLCLSATHKQTKQHAPQKKRQAWKKHVDALIKNNKSSTMKMPLLQVWCSY